MLAITTSKKIKKKKVIPCKIKSITLSTFASTYHCYLALCLPSQTFPSPFCIKLRAEPTKPFSVTSRKISRMKKQNKWLC